MVQCKKCGTQLPDEANYCFSCGTSLKQLKIEELKVSADDLVKTVKKIIHEGNVRSIVVKDDKGKQLIDIPIAVGVVGVVLAPWLAALGVIGALATNCTIIVEREIQ